MFHWTALPNIIVCVLFIVCSRFWEYHPNTKWDAYKKIWNRRHKMLYWNMKNMIHGEKTKGTAWNMRSLRFSMDFSRFIFTQQFEMPRFLCFVRCTDIKVCNKKLACWLSRGWTWFLLINENYAWIKYWKWQTLKMTFRNRTLFMTKWYYTKSILTRFFSVYHKPYIGKW